MQKPLSHAARGTLMTDQSVVIPPDSDPDDCDDEALNWFVRLSDAPHTAHTDAAFQRWLAGRPDRQAAYARWQADWRQMQAFAPAGVEQLRSQGAMTAGARAPDVAAPSSEARRKRLARAALAALLLTLCAGSYLAWSSWQ